MLQIKNTLGGGKPEGLYAWKKNSVSKVDNSITKFGTNYTLGTATSDTIVYYSTSYTFDESTGIYTLVNPQSANLAYNGSGGVATVRMEKSKYYIWGSTSSDKIYTTNDGSTYNVGIKNASGSVYLESTATNEIYDIHSAKAEYTFLDYIVSDKENAYPDGGEKGGCWYERVKDIDLLTAGGYTKIAVDKFTFSSATSITNAISHSLGEIPLFYLIVADIPSASKNDFLGAFYFKPKFQSTNANGVYYYARGNNTYSDPSVGELKTLTDSSISIFNNTTYKYKAGVEYTLITMA